MLNLKNIKKLFSPDFTSGNKPFYISLFIILFCCEAKTQTDYITNGSFEQIDSCYGQPAAIGFDVFEWAGCKGWSNPIASSPDLWCENPKVGIFTPPFISSLGFQYPRTGNNYAGIQIGNDAIINYREYIQNKLTQTLKNNYNYRIEFYVSHTIPDCSPTEIGIKFFNQKFSDASKYHLTYIIPDAVNEYTNFYIDTLNWQKVVINYKANGSENFMIIGNYSDSLHTKYTSSCDTTFWNNYTLAGNYLFIDDISIIELPFKELILPNVFTPNNDGINDNWYINLEGYSMVNCTIYNRWGLKIYETANNTIIWDARTTSGEECSDGVYYYLIEAITPNEEKINLKGFIQLIR